MTNKVTIKESEIGIKCSTFWGIHFKNIFSFIACRPATPQKIHWQLLFLRKVYMLPSFTAAAAFIRRFCFYATFFGPAQVDSNPRHKMGEERENTKMDADFTFSSKAHFSWLKGKWFGELGWKKVEFGLLLWATREKLRLIRGKYHTSIEFSFGFWGFLWMLLRHRCGLVKLCVSFLGCRHTC